jgi:hypothetical protein
MHMFRQAVLRTAKWKNGLFQRTSFEPLRACTRVAVTRALVIELLNTCQMDIGTSEQTDSCTIVCPKSFSCPQRSLPSSKRPYHKLQLDGHTTSLKRANPLPQTADAVRSSSLIKLVRTQSTKGANLIVRLRKPKGAGYHPARAYPPRQVARSRDVDRGGNDLHRHPLLTVLQNSCRGHPRSGFDPYSNALSA